MKPELHVLEMSDEEYIKLVKDKYLRVISHNGVIWREVAPFFWRPVFHFLKYDDRDVHVPISFRLGGYQFPIIEESKANSIINYYIFENVREYDIRLLSRNERKRILYAMKHLEVKREYDLTGFIEKSYPVYHSFYSRSGYKYRSDRVKYRNYAEWARKISEAGKTIILGAYCDNILVGVLTLVYVRGIVVLLSLFTHTDYLKNKPSDLLYHTAREIASKIDGIQFIYAGMMSEDKGINDFKEMRGASLIKAPSYVYMNPIASYALKYFGKNYYHKIVGMV